MDNHLRINTMQLSNKCIILFVFPVLVSLFVACEEEGNDVVIEQQEAISFDSLFFSCIIDNEYLEFKTPLAEVDEISNGVFGYNGQPFDYEDDTVGLNVSRTFSDDRYRKEFVFCDSLIIDTTTTYAAVMSRKNEVMFKEITYPIQLYPFECFSKERPLHWFLGFSIQLTNLENNEVYTSYVDYYLNQGKMELLT